MADARLDELVARLEAAAGELRGGELSADRAAELVEECARLAAETANELDREMRAADVSVAPDDQMRLDSP
jgi:hypothetical protein